MKLLPLAVLAALVLAMSASAGPPGVTELITSELSVTSIVLQQSPGFCDAAHSDFDLSRQDECVVNPFRTDPRCLWNVDDFWTVGAVARKIGAGISASGSTCLITDRRAPFWGARVRAEKGDLRVTLRFDPQNVTLRLDPVQRDRNLWEWKGCLFGPWYLSTVALPSIEDSNGGKGIIGSATATVTNPTGKFIANPEIVFVERPALRGDYCTSEFSDMVTITLNGASFRLGGFVPDE